ncbi:MAG: response regulator, partial [Desulfomonilaceae bacterium]
AFPEAYRTHIKMISESSKRGSDLAKRLLVFSRKTTVELRTMDLNQCVREARKILERTIPKMISIELFLEDGLPNIQGDPTELEQVLVNLAINARDAMPDGGRLTFETHRIFLDEEYARTHYGCTPGQYVLLTVSDTGVGMDKETLSRIYEPFFTTKEAGKGTGLGLAVVYGIIKQHGARIGCYSEVGKGTTFKIYFPVAEAPVKETSADEGPVLGGTETILLVDDEPAIRDLGRRLLANAGYEVLLATNGKEALDIYRAHRDRIALVILDLIMPEMGGKQCMKELLAMNKSLKIVVTSGHSANGVSEEAMNLGAKDFIQKPFELRRVLRQVRAVLDAPSA